MSLRHRALRFGPFEAILVASLSLTAYVLWRSDRKASEVVAREERGLAFLRRVLAAEQSFRASGRRDADGDGKPEFGSLDDAAGAGALPGPVVRDERGAFLSTPGYRVEVLLP